MTWNTIAGPTKHVNPAKSKCKIKPPKSTCCQLGSPGFKTSGFVRESIYHGALINSTPQECCMTCLNFPGCAQWFFTNGNHCFFSTSREICSNDNLIPIGSNDISHGGNMRCSGGCLP